MHPYSLSKRQKRQRNSMEIWIMTNVLINWFSVDLFSFVSCCCNFGVNHFFPICTNLFLQNSFHNSGKVYWNLSYDHPFLKREGRQWERPVSISQNVRDDLILATHTNDLVIRFTLSHRMVCLVLIWLILVPDFLIYFKKWFGSLAQHVNMI